MQGTQPLFSEIINSSQNERERETEGEREIVKDGKKEKEMVRDMKKSSDKEGKRKIRESEKE